MKSGSRIAVCITLGVLLFCAGFYCRDAMTRDVIVVEPERAVVTAEPTTAPTPEPSELPANAVRAVSLAETVSDDGRIDLNSATQAELETLPGIGPVLAARIIEYREAGGGFSAVEEMLNVSGIGEKKFSAIKDLVKVEE